MDDEKPATRHFRLRPKEIIPTDQRSLAGDGKAISVQLIHRENLLAEERSSRMKGSGLPPKGREPEPVLSQAFRPRDIVPLDMPARPGAGEAITVPQILLENQIAENKSGWGRLKLWKRRKSRRDRDFLITVGTIDVAIAILMKALPGGITMIYGIAGITLVTSTTVWIMYVVNDDY